MLNHHLVWLYQIYQIYLPVDTFYITPVETYILAITKKFDSGQTQMQPVFSYLVGEIGETRDVKRAPINNDLVDMANEFHAYKANPVNYVSKTLYVRWYLSVGFLLRSVGILIIFGLLKNVENLD